MSLDKENDVILLRRQELLRAMDFIDTTELYDFACLKSLLAVFEKPLVAISCWKVVLKLA